MAVNYKGKLYDLVALASELEDYLRRKGFIEGLHCSTSTYLALVVLLSMETN